MISSLTINTNREDIQSKYVDSIVSRLDFIETRYLLKDYLRDELSRYSDDDLLDEIRARGPEYVNDVFETFQENVVLS